VEPASESPLGRWLDAYLGSTDDQLAVAERCIFSLFATTATNLRALPQSTYAKIAAQFAPSEYVTETAFFVEIALEPIFGAAQLEQRALAVRRQAEARVVLDNPSLGHPPNAHVVTGAQTLESVAPAQQQKLDLGASGTARWSWETDVYRLQRPSDYPTFSSVRSQCNWSSPVSLLEHTRANLQAAYSWPDDLDSFMRSHNSRDPTGLLTRECRQRWRDKATGDDIEWTITRIGPVVLSADETSINSQIEVLFLAAVPGAAAGHSAYITESLDTYLDMEGRDIAYPPVHPHHSNSQPVGFPESATCVAEEGIFAGFQPWTPQSASAFTKAPGLLSTSNSPGFGADLLGCKGGSGTSSCYYLNAAHGLGERAGWVRPAHTDMWSSSVVNTVDARADVELTLEYARKWVVPSRPELWTQLHTLDFSVVGTGAKYLSPATQEETGLAWHTYTMPRAGTFVASWFHTHAQGPSDLWVLDVAAETVLPSTVTQQCEDTGGCGVSRGISRGTLAPSGPFALEPLGLSAAGVQASIATTSVQHVRCAFRSRTEALPGGTYAYGRSPLRAATDGCDGWRFAAGDKVALIAFNWPTKLVGHQQHQRWWPIATFDDLDVSDLS